PSSPFPDLNASGIFKIILQNPNPLILQPTAWLPKEIFMSLNNPAIPIPSINLPSEITKVNIFQSMKMPHTLPHFHSRGSSSNPLYLEAGCYGSILPSARTQTLLPVGAHNLGDFYTCTFTCSIIQDFLIFEIDHPKYQTQIIVPYL